ncbi:MAG: TolC family protein [Planctomycetaceae bacterium]|nr:TolC family protein [Planctomycetaceae bacterium]
MCSHTENATARARWSSRAKLFCWSGALTAAWLSYSAWAGPQSQTASNPAPRFDQRASVQLGFIADEEPLNEPLTVPQRVAPNIPPPDFPAPVISAPLAPSAPFDSRPRLPQAINDGDDAQPLDISAAWWSVFVTAPLRENTTPVTLSIEEILVRAIRCSSQVRVFSDLPLIRETSITEADAAFDWTAFLDTRWQDLNDPVGSTLTIGTPGVNRYKDEHFTGQGGVRKRTREGGTLQLSEQLGWQRTNSTFFTPNPQGASRLVLGYTHPLLRGSGQVYNESLICLAQLDTEIAFDEFSRQLQSHLLEVLRAYWGLYLERANLAQKLQSLRRASDTLALLKQRQQLDAVRSQILRARAEVATRRSQVIRAQMGVKNSEDRIRALVNDPAFGDFDTVELMPTEPPTISESPLSMSLALTTAATTRPEVNQALRQIQAGCTRLNMSKNEVLPMLNLVTETYVAGLQPDSAFSAFNNSFNSGAPGYTVGLQFEMPLGNRAPQARRERRELELRQLRNQYETTLNTLQLEVKVSVREVETAMAEMLSQFRAMDASTAELQYLEQRFERLPGEDGNASLMLDNLLLAQQRLATNEFNFLTAQVTYNLALWNVKKATGELLQTEQVSWNRACVDGLPTLVVDKYGKPVEYQRGGEYVPTPVQEAPRREFKTPPPPLEDEPAGPALRPTGGRVEPKASFWQSTKNKVLRRDP